MIANWGELHFTETWSAILSSIRLLPLPERSWTKYCIDRIPYCWYVSWPFWSPNLITAFSCNSGCRAKFHVILHASCRLLGIECRQGITRAYNDKVSSTCGASFYFWKWASVIYLFNCIELTQCVVLYAVGIVELELESTSALVLLIFVIPLAFTLSGFLLWIMYSLNGRSTVCFQDVYWQYLFNSHYYSITSQKTKI